MCWSADGYKKIEDIKIGDTVLAWNEETGKQSWRTVTHTFVRETDLIYILTFENGEVIETTWNHPFYIPGQGWVEAKDLRPGDGAINSRGERVQLKSSVQDHRTETVYNFEVEEDHTYYVGQSQVLVHNDECRIDWTRRRAGGVATVTWDDYAAGRRLYELGVQNAESGVHGPDGSGQLLAASRADRTIGKVVGFMDEDTERGYREAKDGAPRQALADAAGGLVKEVTTWAVGLIANPYATGAMIAVEAAGLIVNTPRSPGAWGAIEMALGPDKVDLFGWERGLLGEQGRVNVRIGNADLRGVNANDANRSLPASAPRFDTREPVIQLTTARDREMVRLVGANGQDSGMLYLRTDVETRSARSSAGSMLSTAALMRRFNLNYTPVQIQPVVLGRGARIQVGNSAPHGHTRSRSGVAGGSGFQVQVLHGAIQNRGDSMQPTSCFRRNTCASY